MSGKPTGAADAAAPAAPVRQRPAGDLAPPRPADDATAWTEYVAAARQLDGVRRGAATAATEQARAVRAAREELTTVRERLAPQRFRLRELGVSPMALVPSPPELTEAARSMVGGPTAVLTALRAARAWVDGADGVLTARGPFRPAAWPPRLRNLLVYGPLALVFPLLQVVLYLAVGTGPAGVVSLLLGVPMPVVAFVAGWLLVGRLFGGVDDPVVAGPGHRRADPPTPEPRAPLPRSSGPAPTDGLPQGATADGGTADGGTADGGAPAATSACLLPGSAAGRPVDRTPRWGALVCIVPAVSTTAGLLLAMLAG
ncbi:hypothetical protein [Micromonospora sp. DT233]|uniref:hypothetical protein n=1 Tax=Micromonospora sp. DT233 TaxID=3393432 RepID=UPI003CF60FC7